MIALYIIAGIFAAVAGLFILLLIVCGIANLFTGPSGDTTPPFPIPRPMRDGADEI